MESFPAFENAFYIELIFQGSRSSFERTQCAAPATTMRKSIISCCLIRPKDISNLFLLCFRLISKNSFFLTVSDEFFSIERMNLIIDRRFFFFEMFLLRLRNYRCILSMNRPIVSSRLFPYDVNTLHRCYLG